MRELDSVWPKVGITTLKMASYRRKVQHDAMGKVNRIKEIRRIEKDGLKINRQQHFVRKRVSRVDSVRWRGILKAEKYFLHLV